MRHILISDVKDLHKLKGSKYVQSDTHEIYGKIIALLEQNKQVLFSGTPCQIAGLKACLKKDYDNLITIDILCHGTPSVKVYKKYVAELKTHPTEQVLQTNFRDKTHGWNSYMTATTTYDPEEKIRKKYAFPSRQDTFMQAFLNNMCLRDSCLTCRFSNLKRPADITLGDFWKIEKYALKLNDEKGTSMVLLNTPRGKSFYKKFAANTKFCKKVPLKVALKSNQILSKPSKAHPQTEAFWQRFEKYSLEDNVKISLGKKFDCGILNFWFCSNYGAMLTCFALQKTLERLGKNAKVINYIPFAYKKYLRGKAKDFADKYLKITDLCHTKQDLTKLNDQTDTFIVGSDQVWRYRYFWKFGGNIFQLNFVRPNNKKIAYAASFGTDKFEADYEKTQRTKYYLQRFDNISVREDEGVDLCRETFDVKATHVLDPVFLLSEDEWAQILQNATSLKKSFITSYILDQTPSVRHILKELKKSFGQKEAVDIANGSSKEKTSIEDWVYNIKNSDFFITDSFHGTCLAIIFNKQFITLANTERGFSRFRSLLKMFELEERCVLPEDNPDIEKIIQNKINYARVNEIWARERKKSLTWLQNALDAPHVSNKETEALEVLQYELEETKENMLTLLEMPRIKKKYLKYKILSKITFGRRRKKYTEKKKLLKEKLQEIKQSAVL